MIIATSIQDGCLPSCTNAHAQRTNSLAVLAGVESSRLARRVLHM
jgi:hypothetical protein